ncbi:serine carboxypeptidase-like 18 [Salvia miltiorrhiza]|uniref:serine carboxypeptidase-like 18 n=1 Tax=Salvia miltiorrhiza TaxID=226208 RepID=UPI0025AD2B78|nr:serine carboxypeptidase-like 18 [Salvia miltiorrhiza]
MIVGMKSRLHLLLVFLIGIKSVASQSIVESLPGYAGTLPFTLETGYIGVGENDEVQLFYYFIESENEPTRDPLLLWLNGGPGCSAFSGLVYEIGPLAFDIENFDGSLPSFILNPYSWTKVANIIFLDYPVGTGFSYSNTSKGYPSSDTKSTQHNYTFLRKWLLAHPAFLKNRLFVSGDSYGGYIVPMVALQIAKGNEAGLQPIMSLKGYIIGNPLTDEDSDANEKIPYAHRMALISDKQFEQARSSCNGEYVNPDPNNIQCLFALSIINERTKLINGAHILEPKCKFLSPKPSDSRRFLVDVPVDLLSLSNRNELKCRNMRYATSYVWANDETVREALHIRKGTITDWTRCNKSLSYEYDIESAFEYHQILSDRGFQALVYSGDHDMDIPYMATLKWIRKLNVSLEDEWRAWNVDGQVAGYTEMYKNNQASIIFATVKGAGHTAPEYKPKECLEMIKRWLSLYPL